MIIYEASIAKFIDQCKPANQDLLVTSIKANMKTKMGRGVGPSEERSWRTTLVKVSKFFEHIKSKEDQYILLEFKVPTTQRRIDIILVGADGKRNSLLIIELKGWSKSHKSNVKNALEINANYKTVGHPNKEAEEYRYLLTQQFSDINNEFENIDSISLLPNYELVKNDPILSSEFEEVLKLIKLYTKNDIDEFKKLLSSLFNQGIPRRKIEFLNKLEYNPSINFQKHLKNQFKNIRLSASQDIAYQTIIREVDRHLSNPKNKKLITIAGMPGSGKTIIAFKVMGYIYAKRKMTAKLQLPGPEFKEAVKEEFGNNSFSNMIGGAYAKGEQQVQIIDEAHKAYGQGYATTFYSQLFENQNFVITLIDDNQIINKKGFTKKQVIGKARENNFDVIELELSEQFRNGADALYIDWINNWVLNEKNNQDYYVNNTYNFKVLNNVDFNNKYKSMYESYNVRMVSFWTQKWNAEFDDKNQPKKLIEVGSSKYIWNPNNYWVESFKENNPNSSVPRWFTNDVVGKNFNKDKKGYEYIAYFNTIQGSEFDYIFVHVPALFFVNENEELDVDLSKLDMNDMHSQVWTKNHLPNKDKEDLNKMYFKNRLLVALTRGKKGTYVFCEDEKLSKWIDNKLIKK